MKGFTGFVYPGMALESCKSFYPVNRGSDYPAPSFHPRHRASQKSRSSHAARLRTRQSLRLAPQRSCVDEGNGGVTGSPATLTPSRRKQPRSTPNPLRRDGDFAPANPHVACGLNDF